MNGGQRDSAADELSIATTALSEARMLAEAGLTMGAVSRLYYAVFHAARAALVARGRGAKTHSGQVKVFVATFGATPLLSRLLEARINADYRSDRFATTAVDLEDHLIEAAQFLEHCASLVDDEVAKGVNDPDPPPDL